LWALPALPLLNESLSKRAIPSHEQHHYFFTIKMMSMVKKSRDEPDDKALERLRQFEQ
jgi:hypothetical protein